MIRRQPTQITEFLSSPKSGRSLWRPSSGRIGVIDERPTRDGLLNASTRHGRGATGDASAETLLMTGARTARRPMADLFALACFGLAVAVVAIVGGLASASASAQYRGLVQPSWAPPSWLFGPVWTVLYVMIAVSGWLVWRRAGWVRSAHGVYAVQLVLNMLWSPLFFGAGLLGLAFVDILLLAASVVATIVLFARVSRLAAVLLVPYLAWVGFASVLNFAIWQLN